MGQSLNADGRPEQPHHIRQREAMLTAGKMFADERERNAAAIDLLFRITQAIKHHRPVAELVDEAETLLIAAHNSNREKGK